MIEPDGDTARFIDGVALFTVTDVVPVPTAPSLSVTVAVTVNVPVDV